MRCGDVNGDLENRLALHTHSTTNEIFWITKVM